MEATFVSSFSPPKRLDSPAYWFVFQGWKMLVLPQENERLVQVPLVKSLDEVGITAVLRQQYHGYFESDSGQQTHCFSAEIDEDVALPEGGEAEGLRGLFPRLESQLFAVAGRSVQIMDWDRTHQYCARCGDPVQLQVGEPAKKCLSCGQTHYPRLSPAVIVAISRDGEQGREILLARNKRFPPGWYSVLAGFVEPGESLEQCVAREVFEEVCVRVDNIRYFSSQPWPFPHSLMIGFTADYVGGEFVLQEAEIDEAHWFRPDALPKIPPRISIARQLIDAFVAENRAEAAGDGS